MPVNSVENRLLLYSIDGDNYSPIALSLYDISIDNVVETDNSRSIKYLQNPISMTITLPHKKMSRKKFKKWLMSFPIYERNEADRWCRFIGCAKGRVGYFRTYFDTLLVPYSFYLMQAIVKQLKETKK